MKNHIYKYKVIYIMASLFVAVVGLNAVNIKNKNDDAKMKAEESAQKHIEYMQEAETTSASLKKMHQDLVDIEKDLDEIAQMLKERQNDLP